MARHNDLGEEGEALAAACLERKGYRILERGWRCPLGQIDLIAKDGETYVFVEAKARGTGFFGGPELALTPKQKSRIIRSALAYLKRLEGYHRARFDLVAIEGAEVRHYPNAFTAEGWTY